MNDDEVLGELPLAGLVERALANDQAAWRALVDRLKGVVWKVLYSFDLAEDDRKDAFASTFFRLYEKLATVREPEKLPGWLATTARNEAMTSVRRQRRTVPMAELPLREAAPGDHDAGVLDDELKLAMRRAFDGLPAKAQALLRLLCADPPMAYDDISRLLDIPRGSIGPTRQRYLELLRRSPELAPFLESGTT